MNISDKISDKLGVGGLSDDESAVEILELENENEIFPVKPPTSGAASAVRRAYEIDEDYKLARDTLRDTIGTAINALDGAMKMAEETTSPRAYEVVGGLIRSLSDTTKDLLEIQGKAQMLDQKEEALNGGPPIIQNNSMFIGSTQELLEIIKAQEKKNLIGA